MVNGAGDSFRTLDAIAQPADGGRLAAIPQNTVRRVMRTITSVWQPMVVIESLCGRMVGTSTSQLSMRSTVAVMFSFLIVKFITFVTPTITRGDIDFDNRGAREMVNGDNRNIVRLSTLVKMRLIV